ncbi:MAG: hypothetical protein ACKOA6_13205 [Actinomycetota bacterium]
MRAAAKRPFWLHQVAEYVIGLAAIASGLQSPDPLLPAVTGGLVLLNAAIADGPFAAFRLVGRRVHRLADVVVVALMAALVAVPGAELSVRLTQVALTAVFVVVVMGTDYRAPIEKKARQSAAEGTSDEIGRMAGRVAGSLAARVRDRKRAN